MSDLLYYCTQDNNICPKKDECLRYVNAENKNNTTLFKMSCTEDNDYVLFIKHEQVINEKFKETDNK